MSFEPEGIYGTPIGIIVGPEFTAPEITDLIALHWDGLREEARRLDRQQALEAWAQETRLLWSGPDRLQRQILRTYRLKPRHIGVVPRSVFTSEYRRRQRARVQRRRR